MITNVLTVEKNQCMGLEAEIQENVPHFSFYGTLFKILMKSHSMMQSWENSEKVEFCQEPVKCGVSLSVFRNLSNSSESS